MYTWHGVKAEQFCFNHEFREGGLPAHCSEGRNHKRPRADALEHATRISRFKDFIAIRHGHTVQVLDDLCRHPEAACFVVPSPAAHGQVGA